MIDFSLAVAKVDHQTAKFNFPPNFPAIQYFTLHFWQRFHVTYHYTYIYSTAHTLTVQLHNAKVALDSHDGFEKGIHVQLPKEIWAIAGCSDFFQNLNFALSQTEAHSPWVTLSAPAVKLERKLLHFASTSVAAVCTGQ